MAKQRTVVDVVEAAYDVVADDEVWLRRILDAVRPELDQGFGIGGILFDMSDPRRLRSWAATSTEMPAGIHHALVAGIPTVSETDAKALFLGAPVSTMSGDRGPEYIRRSPPGQLLVESFGVHDIVGVKAMDPTLAGCVLSICLPRVTELLPSFVRTWGRVASHIAAGFRLRRGPVSSARDLADGAEAVLAPNGKTVHAADAASSPKAREALRTAAVAVDRARRMAKRDPEEAIGLWRGLVAGRWSLVDRFDTDGRRFLVVKRNDPEPAQPPAKALTLRERQIVGYAALGHSNKLIAYELGLSESTVAVRLKSAAEKLGCRSRIELVRLTAAPRE